MSGKRVYALIDETPLVGVIMGSGSDWEKVKPAAQILKYFGVPFETGIKSAHRTAGRMSKYAETAYGRGIRVIIAAAGGAAHLPGMVAAQTPIPVIGLPIALTYVLDEQAALLSIVQMPNGVPVATVGIGRPKNAGLLAVKILGVAYPVLIERLAEEAAAIETDVVAEDTALSANWETYAYSPK